MSQHTWYPGHFAEVNEQGVDAFFNSTDIEESNLGMDNALLGNVAPNTLIATVQAQDDILDGFDPDDIDYEGINASISTISDLPFVFQDESTMQQQQLSSSQGGQNSHDYAQFTWPNFAVDPRSQDAHSASIARISHPIQQWPPWSHPPQTPQSVSQHSYASSQPVQLSHAQAQIPWMNHESHGQSMRSINQQQYSAHQCTTSHTQEPTSTEPQGGLRYPSPVHLSAPQPRAMATDNKTSTKSSGNRKQKKPSETPRAQASTSAQVSAQTTQPIAASAPQPVRFTSFAQVQQAAATRVVPHNYTPPANDPSFPKDDAARKAYIRQMYDAYVDITECIDRATVPNFDSHFATLSSNPPSSPITPFMISTICWHLLTIAIDLHPRGPVCLNVFDPAKLKNVYKHRNLKFDARIDAICELLRTSKSRCMSLLKLDGLGMVVASAPLLCKQSRTNHTSNGHRQDYLVTGKDVVAGKKREAGKMAGDGDEAEDEDAGESDE